MTPTIDYFPHKTCVYGLQGSGKTFFVQNAIVPTFKKPMVFEVNKGDDWNKLKRIYVYQTTSQPHNIEGLKKEFEKWLKFCLQLAEEGKIDAIIIDEADLFLKNLYDIPPTLYYLLNNHRHVNNDKGVALVFITRRPQDIPSVISETSKWTIAFQLEGKNAIQRLNDIRPEFGNMVANLPPHYYLVKKIAEDPVQCSPIKVKKKS